jgi:hypothetical protein
VFPQTPWRHLFCKVEHCTMTTTDSPPLSPRLRPEGVAAPIERTPYDRAALRQLLLAARDAEVQASGPALREAYRTSRSLIAAAVILGFTFSELAEMLDVTVGSVRNRSNILHPIPRASFAALVTATDDRLTIAVSERREDPVQLLTWYLAATFIAEGLEESA